MKQFKLSSGIAALMAFSSLSQASEGSHLHCIPSGYNGAPEIQAEIASDDVLDSVTVAYIFEQGEMQPAKVGRVVAAPTNDKYALRLFVLSDDKVSKEYVTMPKNLSELPAGSKFTARYTDIAISVPQAGTTHATLNCTVNLDAGGVSLTIAKSGE
jgi:hypothetical protein